MENIKHDDFIDHLLQEITLNNIFEANDRKLNSEAEKILPEFIEWLRQKGNHHLIIVPVSVEQLIEVETKIDINLQECFNNSRQINSAFDKYDCYDGYLLTDRNYDSIIEHGFNAIKNSNEVLDFTLKKAKDLNKLQHNLLNYFGVLIPAEIKEICGNKNQFNSLLWCYFMLERKKMGERK